MPASRVNFSRALKAMIVCALGVSGILLLAFGPRAGDEYPKDCVIVDYWEKWTGVEEAAMKQIVDDFNRTVGKEKKIFVRYLSTSSIEQKTLVATAAGVPPDVAGLYNQTIAQFASMDALEPLDELAASRQITSDVYKKVYWDQCCFEGKLYGLVSTAYDLGLYVNTELMRQRSSALKAAGLDPNRPPQTIQELDAYAKALDVYDEKGRLISAGYLPLEPDWYLTFLPVFFGGEWWDNTNHRFTFTDPKVVKTYTWLQSYSKRLGSQAVGEFRSGLGNFDSPQNAFLSGAVVMEQQGTFLANFIHNQKPSLDGKWAAFPFPTDEGRLPDTTYCNADVLVIPRGAQHKREAFEFIAFVNQQSEMEKLARLHCKISPLTAVSEGFMTDHPNPYVRVFDRLAASPNAKSAPPIPILPEVVAETNNLVQRLGLMLVTPEEGLAEIQVRLQKKYDDYIASQNMRRMQAK